MEGWQISWSGELWGAASRLPRGGYDNDGLRKGKGLGTCLLLDFFRWLISAIYVRFYK